VAKKSKEDLEITISIYLFILAYLTIAMGMLLFGARFLTSLAVAVVVPTVALFVYIVRSSKLSPEERRLQRESAGWLFPKGADVSMNSGPGTFQYEVVGESHYLQNLQTIISAANLISTEPGELFCQAFLLCEPTNPHDANAVAVVISHKTVGHIPRGDAQELAPQLRRLANTRTSNGRGGQVLCVQACIGWSGPERIGVRLDLEEF
jgi:hypothetical protein